MASSKLKLGGKLVDFEPMTWKLQKEVFKLVVKALGQQAEAQEHAAKALMALLRDDGKPKLQPMLELLQEIPETLTELLAKGTGITVADIDSGTGMEVLALLDSFLEVNEISSQMTAAKKAAALLAPVKQG